MDLSGEIFIFLEDLIIQSPIEMNWEDICIIVDDFKWFKINMKCSKDEMQSSSKEEKFDSFDNFWYFGYILSFKYWIEMILESFWSTT